MNKPTSPSLATSSKPRRRWFQFSLRTLLIVTLLTCCFLGWLSIRRRQSQEAWKGIAFLEEQRVWLKIEDFAKPDGSWLEQQLGINLPRPAEEAEVHRPRDPERILQEVAKLPGLERLTFAFAENVTDEHLAPLANLKHLTMLDLSSTSINGSGLAYFSGSTSLEWITLRRCSKLTDEGLRSLPPLPCLTHLFLDQSSLSGTGLSHLKEGFPKLEFLSLLDTPISERGLEELGKLHRLKRLELDFWHLVEQDLRYLDELQQLEELNIRGMKLSDQDLYHLGKHPHLVKLDLEKMPITDAGMVHLRDLRELTFLILSDTAIGDQGLENIGGEQLEHLRLNRTRITDASAAKMATFQKLRGIDLTGTQITDECMPLIASLPALEYVSLEGTKITEAALAHFHHHKTLKRLSLSKNLQGTQGVAALKLARPELIIKFY